MSGDSPVMVRAHGARAVAIQWISGVLFVIGILGVLRRHFDGFIEAPGAPILGMTATPLVYLVMLLLGCLGIAALRAPRLAARYLPITAVTLLLITIGGLAAGGPDADWFAINRRMVVLLLVLAAAATAIALWSRRRGSVS